LDERSEAAAGETAGKHEPSHPLFVLTNVLRYIMVLPVFATFITGCALIVYGLMETFAPATAWHQASCKLVDDDYLAVLNYIIAIPLIKDVRAQRLLHVVVHLDIRRII